LDGDAFVGFDVVADVGLGVLGGEEEGEKGEKEKGEKEERGFWFLVFGFWWFHNISTSLYRI